jgi:predicted AAA+ superfamily ATPase
MTKCYPFYVIIEREKDFRNIKNLIKDFPVTAILGPRQCGKTFLAQQMDADHYFDLENLSDHAAFQHPQTLLDPLKGLIVIDEVQRQPELFSVLRYLVDHNPQQKYLLLGSASGALLRQSSESLAGRIGYYYLSGFQIADVGGGNIRRLWLRGGFPRAYLARNNESCRQWQDNYLTTFFEKDLPQLGITIPSQTLRRFWTMLSNYHGQIINFSEIGRSFGVSDMTVRKYIDILQSAFMIRVLQPWFSNIGKRLVKNPKIYFRDSGLFHRLLSLSQERDLLGHAKLGSSWEGFALECLIENLVLHPQEIYFWSTHAGAEIDLIWQASGKWWGAEFKYSDAPTLTKSMSIASSDLNLKHLWVIYPGKKEYPLARQISALPISSMSKIEQMVMR